MNKIKTMSFAVILVFAASVVAQSNLAVADTQFVETNFELFYYTNSGSRTTESYALYVKQALAPLGIDVKIFAKPWGQFVGDLLHSTAGQPFDIAHVRFSGGSPTPAFDWHYGSSSFFGSAMLQLDNEDWQANQEADIGKTAAEIDDMIFDIDFELDLTKRLAAFETFNQFYFDNLLYDLPVVARSFITAMWKGYGGPNNELWSAQDGIVASRALGADWSLTDMPETRKNYYSGLSNGFKAEDTFRFSNRGPQAYNLDPDQSEDSEQTDLSRWTHNGLIQFDKDWQPHPDIAWNYYQETGLNLTDYTGLSSVGYLNQTSGETNIGENMTEATRYTFFVNPNAQWSATKDADGNDVAAHPVDANDFALAYELLYNFILDDGLEVNGEDTYLNAGLMGWNVSTTVTTDDTLTVWYDELGRTPDDDINFAISPLPAHLLGGDLTYTNATDDSVTVGTIKELVFDRLFDNDDSTVALDPWDTAEWDAYESVAGNTVVGAYVLDELEVGEYFNFKSRADFWYPNEWDIDTFYDDGADFTALEASSGFADLSVWAPHRDVDQEAYNWAFAGSESDHTKPTSQGIDVIEYPIIADINADLIAFEAGQLDAFGSNGLGAEQVQKHEENPDLILKAIVPNQGPELIVFNLLNEHLQKIDVRRAITLALDRENFVKIHDGFATPWYSVAYPNSGLYDTKQASGASYDYKAAAALMKANGYFAADDNTQQPDADLPGANEIIGATLPGFEFLAALLGVFVAVPVMRRRRN
jgi:hypothetical protein